MGLQPQGDFMVVDPPNSVPEFEGEVNQLEASSTIQQEVLKPAAKPTNGQNSKVTFRITTTKPVVLDLPTTTLADVFGPNHIKTELELPLNHDLAVFLALLYDELVLHNRNKYVVQPVPTYMCLLGNEFGVPSFVPRMVTELAEWPPLLWQFCILDAKAQRYDSVTRQRRQQRTTTMEDRAMFRVWIPNVVYTVTGVASGTNRFATQLTAVWSRTSLSATLTNSRQSTTNAPSKLRLVMQSYRNHLCHDQLHFIGVMVLSTLTNLATRYMFLARNVVGGNTTDPEAEDEDSQVENAKKRYAEEASWVVGDALKIGDHDLPTNILVNPHMLVVDKNADRARIRDSIAELNTLWFNCTRLPGDDVDGESGGGNVYDNPHDVFDTAARQWIDTGRIQATPTLKKYFLEGFIPVPVLRAMEDAAVRHRQNGLIFGSRRSAETIVTGYRGLATQPLDDRKPVPMPIPVTLMDRNLGGSAIPIPRERDFLDGLSTTTPKDAEFLCDWMHGDGDVSTPTPFPDTVNLGRFRDVYLSARANYISEFIGRRNAVLREQQAVFARITFGDQTDDMDGRNPVYLAGVQLRNPIELRNPMSGLYVVANSASDADGVALHELQELFMNPGSPSLFGLGFSFPQQFNKATYWVSITVKEQSLVFDTSSGGNVSFRVQQNGQWGFLSTPCQVDCLFLFYLRSFFSSFHAE